MKKNKLASSILALLFVVALLLCNSALDHFLPESGDTVPTTAPTVLTDPTNIPGDTEPEPTGTCTLDEDGHYNSKEEVALYIHLYGRLPENYITKSECKALGYANHQAQYAVPDGAIGGDRFGNREGLLPNAPGRTWTECDIDTWDKNARGTKRIVFSNDGLVFYTDDHYESFEQLYGEE